MRAIRSLLVAFLIMAVFLNPSVLAKENNNSKQPVIAEENRINIDVNNKPMPAKLVADYDADYNNLIEQFKNADKTYNSMERRIRIRE